MLNRREGVDVLLAGFHNPISEAVAFRNPVHKSTRFGECFTNAALTRPEAKFGS